MISQHSQHSTATSGRVPHGAGWRGRVAGSALLAVAVVGAIGVWQVREHRSAGTAGQEAAAPVSAAVTPASPTSAGRADAVVYLVASAAQADRVQAEIAAARAFVAGAGVSLPPAVVVVVDGPTGADGRVFLVPAGGAAADAAYQGRDRR